MHCSSVSIFDFEQVNAGWGRCLGGLHNTSPCLGESLDPALSAVVNTLFKRR